MKRPASSGAGSPDGAPGAAAADRLRCWKEIAAHLGVTARTAQRWERLEGLPVHRQMHASLGSAYALCSELDTWRASRRDSGMTGARRSRAARRIAILPFANLNRDLETEIVADGLTEELINTLTQVPGLGVVARTSAFHFKNTTADVREVAASLGVDTVLEGSVRRADGRMRVVAQLIDGKSGLHLWSVPFESRRSDVFGLQQDLAHAVAATLRASLGPGTGGSVEHRTGSGAAGSGYDRYLEGRYYFNRRTPAGFLKAVECFERAVAEDPGMAPAWAALSWCYGNATVTSTLTPREAQEKAMAAARAALDLDPTLAEAHASLGSVCALYSFDWKEAESHFRRALQHKPQLAEAHLFYAAFVLAPTGRLSEAEEHQALASQLDPLSAVVANATGMLRLMQRQYEASAEAFREALRIDPQYPWAHRGLGELALLHGRYAEALQSLARVEMPALAEGLTGYAQARLGRESEARERLRRLEQSGHPSVAYQIATLHLGLSEVAATFRWLERACDERSIGVIWLPVDPIWDEVRDDVRFAQLVAAMGCG